MRLAHACLALLVLVDPIGAGGAVARARSVVASSRVPLGAFVVAFVGAVFVLTAAAALWFLDVVRVTAPDAMVAAGFLAFIPAAVRCVRGRAEALLPDEGDDVEYPAWRLALVPLTVPIAASPAAIATVVAIRADAGWGTTLAAIVVALAGLSAGFMWIRRSEDGRLRPNAVRVMGVAMVVVGVSLIYEGIFVA